MLDQFQGRGEPLTPAAFSKAVDALGARPSSLWAVITVETSGFGFLPDRRPKIRYERHVFHKRTGGKYTLRFPDISSPVMGGNTASVANEYVRLQHAMELDRRAALESTSWGLGQIMGFNARAIGYADAEAMVSDFVQAEDAQLAGMQQFMLANKELARALQDKKWDRFAFFYNGAGTVGTGYARNLAHNEQDFALHGLPDLDVRTIQARLTYLGFSPGGVDGIVGNGTRRALLAFKKANGLNPTPDLDGATMKAVSDAASNRNGIGTSAIG